jgi:hypothetical protein
LLRCRFRLCTCSRKDSSSPSSAGWTATRWRKSPRKQLLHSRLIISHKLFDIILIPISLFHSISCLFLELFQIILHARQINLRTILFFMEVFQTHCFHHREPSIIIYLLPFIVQINVLLHHVALNPIQFSLVFLRDIV